jgi:hypothetical protein
MRWIKESIKSSLQSLLGQKTVERPSPGRKPVPRERLDAIRTAMWTELADLGMDGHEHVARRIEQARDVEALWFLRADLMHALSSLSDEADAARRMARITRLFDGLLSAGLNSRPSPLGDRISR